MRLLLALAVVASHSFPLGFGEENLGLSLCRGQTDVGTLAVCGFFVISGLLITRSAFRLSPVRFFWHRALRILPGFWFALAVTAMGFAPLVATIEKMPNGEFWNHAAGPWAYLSSNWSVGIHQPGISGLLGTVPFRGVFNGSLWSLSYESLCYVGVALLAAFGVLRRARWAVLLLTSFLFGALVMEAITYPLFRAPTYALNRGSLDMPFLGNIFAGYLLALCFMFALGALAELYREYLPMNTALAVVCAVAFLLSARYGCFSVIGLPAYAYLLLWAAMRAPIPLRKIGKKSDYSYGIYIFAFPIQQLLSAANFTRWGFLPYFLLSAVTAGVMAVISWHLIESPALRLKKAWSTEMPPEHENRDTVTVAKVESPALRG
ncbi:O-antigen acetylase [Streptomyces albiflavescens]|uniref:O-antigen acetylase n=1 Tax=Streptomyces albiflavescens TaxID=1623582 RepID=A0A917Y0S2_9ACTN|nr:acyltransferase [Streptomyces albiflavescens]GGN60817.1 O-antigen acetylase [Streptomyces albiflavescens]